MPTDTETTPLTADQIGEFAGKIIAMIRDDIREDVADGALNVERVTSFAELADDYCGASGYIADADVPSSSYRAVFAEVDSRIANGALR